MIKLMSLLKEAFSDDYGKKVWVELPNQKVLDYADNIADLISNAYAAKGGNYEIQTGADLKNSDVTYWVANDLDQDPDADVVVGGKKTPAGTKMTMLGQDGSAEGKKEAIVKMVRLMKQRGFYAEMDPDLAEKLGLSHVDDEATIRKVINKELTMNPDGSYTRLVSGTHKSTKVLVGIPKI